MFSLREGDHLGVAGQAPLPRKGRSSVASASIWISSWLQPGEDNFRRWHGWSEGYSGGKHSREPTLEGPLALRNQLSCQWNVLSPLQGAYQQYPLALLPMTGCQSLHQRVSRSFLERKIRVRCCSLGGGNA